MSSLYWEDFDVGAEYRSGGRTITEADIVNFSGVSGVYHPLHNDEEFCKTTSFGTRIAHGPLILAVSFGLMSKLGLTEETGLAFLGMRNWEIKLPVKIGDTVHVVDRVLEKRKTSRAGTGIVVFERKIMNQNNEVVQSCQYQMLIQLLPPGG